MAEIEFNRACALLLLRVITGVLFFFQAYDKIVKMGIKNVIWTFRDSLSQTFLRGGLLSSAIYASSYIELVGGAMLITGFFKCQVLCLLGVDLLCVSFIFSMVKPMWDMQFFFPRLAMITTLLLCPPEWDIFTLGKLLGF